MATPKKAAKPTQPAKDSQAEREYRMILDASEKAAETVRGWAQPVKVEKRTGAHVPVDQQRAK